MFTATDGGIYTLDSCGSGFDTYIHVYNRTGPAITNRPSSPVATCDDCGPCGLRTVLTVNLDPGNYWYVQCFLSVLRVQLVNTVRKYSTYPCL